MCGRFALFSDLSLLEAMFGALSGVELKPRFNIAPTQPVLAVRTMEDGKHEGVFLHWGLIPSWAKDESAGNRMINARSETAAEKPSFRYAMKKRRCLIPADGYYEWQVTATGKQPHFIHLKNRHPMAFAGLWERWKSPDGSLIESCSILTNASAGWMAQIHDRMPVILSADSFALWLDPAVQEPSRLQPFFKPYAEGEMTAHTVSSQVGCPKNQGKALIKPLDASAAPPA